MTFRRATDSSQASGFAGQPFRGQFSSARHERFRERVFRTGQVARASREQGDELAVAATRHRVGHAASLHVAVGRVVRLVHE